MSNYCYLTFPTTYFAVRAESLMSHQPYAFRMVPVLRSISTSCGTALRCARGDAPAIEAYLAAHGVEVDGVTYGRS